MKFRMIASLVALLLSANCLAAFPERAVTLVAPFPAGGAADVIARLLARQLEIQLGKSVIVENKSGAGSVIGAAYVANAKPDGYTILLGSNSTFVLNPALMAKMPYDAAVDFDVLGKIGTLGLALLVNPQVPAKNVAELIALIRANPDKYSYASYGNGTTSNFAGAMFNSVTGLNVMHIPYKGSTPAMNDTIGGQVPMAYDTWSTRPARGHPPGRAKARARARARGWAQGRCWAKGRLRADGEEVREVSVGKTPWIIRAWRPSGRGRPRIGTASLVE